MSQYLFLFTIGPVQSFIAQARKTQDLYAGSRILSDLIKTGIAAVKGHTIIFPFSDGSDKVESLPNRFVALINEGTDLQQLGEVVEKAVRDEWMRLSTNTVLEKGLQTSSFSLQQGFFEQIRQHLEIHWLFEQITDEGYNKSFKTIERKLGAIKNVRSFEQFNYNNGLGEKGRKCSIDGFRNVKFYRQSENQQNNRTDIRKTFLFADDNCVFDYGDTKLPLSILQPGEGLSAVSFVKRCYKPKYQKRKEFESTAEIALLKTIQFLKAKNEDISLFEENPQLFFRDNLNKDYFKKQGLNVEDISKYEEKLKAFENLTKSEKPEIKFQKYYAILAFDGDSMGEWLSKANSWQEHQHFSQLLIDFAQKAKDYVNDGRGRAVYAGGDDFLGFITLESLFDVLIWMRENFKTEIADKIRFKNADKVLTFSAGVCIAHYKEPLSIVLNRAQQMEHKAKDWRTGKDAFGIAVIKGSGEDHETIWGFENKSLENIEYLVNEMRKENVSNTFLKSFQIEWGRTLDVNGNLTGFEELLEKELGRLILRGINSKFNREDKKKLRDEMVKRIWTDLKLYDDSTKLNNYFALLNICDFLHRTLNSLTSKETEKC